MTIQADGKLLLVGMTYVDGGSDITMVRLFPNGPLDQGFGDGGVKRIDLGGYVSTSSLAIADGGRMILAGKISADGVYYDSMLVRLLEDNTPPNPNAGGPYVVGRCQRG